MFLKNISVRQYKSHTSTDVLLDPGINCFSGKNGVGKTNLLDAVYYLLNGRSYFQASDQLNITRNETWFTLKGLMQEETAAIPLMVSFQTGKRKVIKSDDLPVSKIAEYFGRYPCVVISPDDDDIIKGEGESRRRFFDYMLSVVDHNYLRHLTAYLKTLEMRNKQMKLFLENDHFDPVLVRFYDEKLALHGKEIFQTRRDSTEIFCNYFHRAYREISGGYESPELKYQSELFQKDFEEGFGSTLTKDRALGRTSFGPHRDDWLFELEKLPLKKTGSQGQIKSFLISLKLAMFRLIEEKRQLKPLLLLDDIFEKIDHSRMTKLVDMISKGETGQVIITDTDPERVSLIFAGKRDVHFVQLNKTGNDSVGDHEGIP